LVSLYQIDCAFTDAQFFVPREGIVFDVWGRVVPTDDYLHLTLRHSEGPQQKSKSDNPQVLQHERFVVAQIFYALVRADDW